MKQKHESRGGLGEEEDELSADRGSDQTIIQRLNSLENKVQQVLEEISRIQQSNAARDKENELRLIHVLAETEKIRLLLPSGAAASSSPSPALRQSNKSS